MKLREKDEYAAGKSEYIASRIINNNKYRFSRLSSELRFDYENIRARIRKRRAMLGRSRVLIPRNETNGA